MTSERRVRRLARRAINYAQEQVECYSDYGETERDFQLADGYQEFLCQYDIDDLCIAWRSDPPTRSSDAEGWVDEWVDEWVWGMFGED